MKKRINKLIFHKLIYVLTISMAIIGVIFITTKMFPKVEISKNSNLIITDCRKLTLAQGERTQATLITTRGSNETRENTKNKEEVINTQLTKDTNVTNQKEEENVKENKKDTTNYISISEVKISKNMDLTKRTGLSEKDFIKLISGVKYDTSGFFEENAGTIYDLCKKYSINEIFFCGLISAESGWNIASNHRSTHNYISLMKNGKLIKYNSVYEGLEVAAQKLHNNYLTPGGKFYHGKTLSGVKTNFCPASSTWVDLVYGRMKQII